MSLSIDLLQLSNPAETPSFSYTYHEKDVDYFEAAGTANAVYSSSSITLLDVADDLGSSSQSRSLLQTQLHSIDGDARSIIEDLYL
jgi:hypothetical protein